MQVPFQANVVIQVEQYFSTMQNQSPFPIRLIIAKNVAEKIQYVCGLGQLKKKRIAKNVVLDKGKYLILIQLQKKIQEKTFLKSLMKWNKINKVIQKKKLHKIF